MKNLLITLLLTVVSLTTYSQSKLDYLVLKRVNQYRTELGLNTLKFNDTLFLIAEHHTDYIVKVGERTHTEKSDTPNPYDRFCKYGLRRGFTELGEIIAFATYVENKSLNDVAEYIFQQWKGSPGHHKIMTTPKFVKVGVSTKLGVINEYNRMCYISTLNVCD